MRELLLVGVHADKIRALVALTHVVAEHHPIFFTERNIAEMCSDASLFQFNFQTFPEGLLPVDFLDCLFSGLSIVITYEAVALRSTILFVCHDADADNRAEFERLEEVE